MSFSTFVIDKDCMAVGSGLSALDHNERTGQAMIYGQAFRATAS